jgi:hypothetical protein
MILAVVFGIAAASPAAAQQSFSFHLGGFSPRSADARVPNDVLVNNLSFLAFNIKDFNSFSLGGEYLVGLGDKFEGGLGIGFQTRTVPTVYLDFVNQNRPRNRTRISSCASCRSPRPFASCRSVIMDAVTPYFGAGAGVFPPGATAKPGEFLRPTARSFRRRSSAADHHRSGHSRSGCAARCRNWESGFEVPLSGGPKATAADQGILRPANDLGGFTYAFTAKREVLIGFRTVGPTTEGQPTRTEKLGFSCLMFSVRTVCVVTLGGGDFIQREAGTLAHPHIAVQKRRSLARDAREHVAALGLLLDQYPIGKQARALERGQPDVAVALVQKSRIAKPERDASCM